MGFYRQGMPAALNREGVRAAVTAFVAQDVAFANRTVDPFGIAHNCRNPAGHDFIAACGEVVCSHCGAVAWR